MLYPTVPGSPPKGLTNECDNRMKAIFPRKPHLAVADGTSMSPWRAHGAGEWRHIAQRR